MGKASRKWKKQILYSHIIAFAGIQVVSVWKLVPESNFFCYDYNRRWLPAKVMYPANSIMRFSWMTCSTPIFIVEERSNKCVVIVFFVILSIYKN